MDTGVNGERELTRRWDPPGERTLARYRQALRLDAKAHAARAAEHAEMLALLDGLADHPKPQPDPEPKNLEQVRSRVAGDLAAAKDRLAAVDALLARTRTQPGSLFLPVGALVRTRLPARPETWLGESLAPPVSGSLGVVVGPAERGSEWALKVAFLGYVDTRGRARGGAADAPLTLNLDADDLEVVALARFLDGTECRSVEFVATHARLDDEEERVMVVESNGSIWTIEPVDAGSDRWLSVQGWASRDELDHLRALDEAAPGPAP